MNISEWRFVLAFLFETILNQYSNHTMNASMDKDAQLDIIFYYGAYALWRFLDHVFNIDIRDVCQRVAKEEPVLRTEEGTYVMRVVDGAFDGKLNEDQSKHGNHCTFLINCANVVFGSLKDGVSLKGEFILRDCQFQLDEQLNLELVVNGEPYIDMKIGIIFTPNETNDNEDKPDPKTDTNDE